MLAPMHRGELGAATSTSSCRRRSPRAPPACERGTRVLRDGDKVMQVRNDYDKEVFNGDIGRHRARRSPRRRRCRCSFDDRVVDYGLDELDELVLAYAATVHKSQGSEYPAVVIPVHTQHYVMLQRNLLYTAVTRGKRLVRPRRHAQGPRHRRAQRRRRRPLLGPGGAAAAALGVEGRHL